MKIQSNEADANLQLAGNSCSLLCSTRSSCLHLQSLAVVASVRSPSHHCLMISQASHPCQQQHTALSTFTQVHRCAITTVAAADGGGSRFSSVVRNVSCDCTPEPRRLPQCVAGQPKTAPRRCGPVYGGQMVHTSAVDQG